MEEDNVLLTAGIINATGKMLYWKDEIGVKIGDYAIVESANGFDLIKVVGIIETKRYMAGRFSNTKYENMKKSYIYNKRRRYKKEATGLDNKLALILTKGENK